MYISTIFFIDFEIQINAHGNLCSYIYSLLIFLVYFSEKISCVEVFKVYLNNLNVYLTFYGGRG